MISSSPRYSPYCTSISCIILLPIFDKRCFSRSGMWIHSFSLTTWDFEPNVTVATPSTTIHRSARYLWYCRDVLCPGFTVSRLTLNCFPTSRIVNDPQGRNSLIRDVIDCVFLRFAPVNSQNEYKICKSTCLKRSVATEQSKHTIRFQGKNDFSRILNFLLPFVFSAFTLNLLALPPRLRMTALLWWRSPDGCTLFNNPLVCTVFVQFFPSCYWILTCFFKKQK